MSDVSIKLWNNFIQLNIKNGTNLATSHKIGSVFYGNNYLFTSTFVLVRMLFQKLHAMHLLVHDMF